MTRASRRRVPTIESTQLGVALKAMRVARGLKQIEVAHNAGISEAQVSEMERGVGNPTWAVLTKVLGPGLSASLRELADRYDDASGSARTR